MLRTKLLFGAQVLALALLLTGCGRSTNERMASGTVRDSVYTNSYLGLTVTLPSDWSIQSQQAQKKIFKMGEKIEAGNDKNLGSVMAASESKIVHLFAAFKYPLGSPVSYDPSIMAVAEDVRDFPGIKRGSDFNFQTKQQLEAGALDVSFPKSTYSTSLGGTDFDVMDVTIHVRGIVIDQKYYAAIIKGYALNFIISYTTDEAEASLRKILDTVKFN